MNGPGKACFLEDKLNTEARAKSAKVQAHQGAEAGPEMRSEINLASYARVWLLREGQFKPLTDKGDSNKL